MTFFNCHLSRTPPARSISQEGFGATQVLTNAFVAALSQKALEKDNYYDFEYEYVDHGDKLGSKGHGEVGSRPRRVMVDA